MIESSRFGKMAGSMAEILRRSERSTKRKVKASFQVSPTFLYPAWLSTSEDRLYAHVVAADAPGGPRPGPAELFCKADINVERGWAA